MHSTILGALEHHARVRPDALALVLLDERGLPAQEICYARLRDWSLSLSGALCARLPQGARAILLLPTGTEFVAAFLGCLYSGLIPVPVSIPRAEAQRASLLRVIDNSQAECVLTTRALLARHRQDMDVSSLAPVPEIPWFAIEDLRSEPMRRDRDEPGELAFLQYTSGSTGAPKGVMVSHGNLAANLEMIREAFGHDEHSNCVGWLPLFHDQGLIGNALQPLWNGATSILLTPMTFLKRPWLWLHALSRYRAHTAGAPNFAYEQLLRTVQDARLSGVDLSQWRVAFNGAEPIRAGTLQRFSQAFSRFGFQARAHCPCYGLAEATVFVSAARKDCGARTLEVDRDALQRGLAQVVDGGDTIVSCGYTRGELEISIVDPDRRTGMGPNSVGEIWLRGPSVAMGYFGNREATRTTFGATRADASGRYLRTGDLGFVDASGELFVTGRSKDVIIVDGRNHYPSDLELTVRHSAARLRLGTGAAFAIERHEQVRLVVIQEIAISDGLADLEQSIRRGLRNEHGLSPHEVLFVRRGQVPRTTSGKVRRAEARRRYLEGALQIY